MNESETGKLLITWSSYASLEKRLQEKLSKYRDIDFVVGIARGGVYPAFSMANKLNFKSDSIRVASYNDVNNKEEVKILQGPCMDLNYSNLLLIDDISDTGETFIAAIKYLKKKYNPSKIYSASLLVKPWTKFLPDVYLESTDKWVVFPWE